MSKIKSIATSLYEISADEDILDIFLWKNGIYVYILLVTALFLFQKKRARLLWAVLPSVFYLVNVCLGYCMANIFVCLVFPAVSYAIRDSINC